MPFQSKSQVRACFANKRRNPNSTWNCREWLHETSNVKSLPEKKQSPRRSPSKKQSPRTSSNKTNNILTGPRGGKYYIANNKKVYIK